LGLGPGQRAALALEATAAGADRGVLALEQALAEEAERLRCEAAIAEAAQTTAMGLHAQELRQLGELHASERVALHADMVRLRAENGTLNAECGELRQQLEGSRALEQYGWMKALSMYLALMYSFLSSIVLLDWSFLVAVASIILLNLSLDMVRLTRSWLVPMLSRMRDCILVMWTPISLCIPEHSMQTITPKLVESHVTSEDPPQSQHRLLEGIFRM